MLEISIADDQRLRMYARRLHPEFGEDAYHTVVCEVLQRHVVNIHNFIGFFRVAIRNALYKMFRHEKSERTTVTAFINDDPIAMQRGLRRSQQPLVSCRKDMHLLVEGNLAYVGKRRTCRACKRLREAVAARVKRARQKEVHSGNVI